MLGVEKQRKTGSAIHGVVDVRISAGSKSSHVGLADVTNKKVLETASYAYRRTGGADNDFERHPGGDQHAIDIAHARG